MEELQSNFRNYKLQYQQVEAALTTDPENEDLQKLKKDLQEVTDLTSELIKNHEATSLFTQETAVPASNSGEGDNTSHAPSTTAAVIAPQKTWQVGEKCSAQWSKNDMYSAATIEEILEDGSCTVTFDIYGNTDITQVALLKPLEASAKRENDDGDSQRPKTKRDKIAAEREYKKKKSQKKAQRQKQMEEERETEKNKWLDFNTKVFSKTTKGKVKKSIFASPDTVTGRVGVGTCGLSGKPMTQFTQHEKWKK